MPDVFFALFHFSCLLFMEIFIVNGKLPYKWQTFGNIAVLQRVGAPSKHIALELPAAATARHNNSR
jgi:hypothetical protein